jgi:hypothetical protein
LHSSEWGTLPSDFDTQPTINANKASRKVAKHASRLLAGGKTCSPELQILTLTPSSANDDFGNGYKHTLVWKVCPKLNGQEQEIMEGIVDAHTGQVYSFVDRVDYLDSTGAVYPFSNDGKTVNGFPDGVLQSGYPMPYMTVGGVTTTTGGYFDVPSGSASFSGPYAKIADNCGSASLSVTSVGLNWGSSGGTDCTNPPQGGTGNTHSARTGFYELNKVRVYHLLLMRRVRMM